MKKCNISCDLKSCFLCKGCLNEWLPALEKQRQNFVFRKGRAIFSEGDPVTGIYFLYRGKVKVATKWGKEKELILRFAKEGDIIGYRGIGKEKVYQVSATALEEVNVCFINSAFFETTLRVNHSLTYLFMQFYANELQEVEKRMINLVHMEVKGRVAETLLMLKNQFGETQGFINISLTKQDLASYAGTTYETFSRMIGDLEKDNIVCQSGKNFGIVNEKKLAELVC